MDVGSRASGGAELGGWLTCYLLEAEPHRHLKSTDPLSFRRSQRCSFPNMSLLNFPCSF